MFWSWCPLQKDGPSVDCSNLELVANVLVLLSFVVGLSVQCFGDSVLCSNLDLVGNVLVLVYNVISWTWCHL